MKYTIYFLALFSYLFSAQPSQGYDYNILVLSSGGATSIMSAVILQHLEQKIKLPIDRIFNEIWCSSAGSIIAALLTTDHSHHKKAREVIEFFKDNFSSYYRAYHICDTLEHEIGSHVLMSETSIPLRILTSVNKNPMNNSWKLYDFSSDGSGSCTNKQIPLSAVVRGSCTVYPYLYRTPEKIRADKKKDLYCIDAGSLCCEPAALDPTAYFLEQLLEHLEPYDTLTIYFIGNVFTPTIDDQKLKEILQKYNQFSYAIRYYEGSIEKDRKQIEVINVPVTTHPTDILKRYMNNCSLPTKIKIKALITIFENVIGKDNGVPNLLATGTIPLSFLIEEAENIARHSKNFQAMIGILQELKK